MTTNGIVFSIDDKKYIIDNEFNDVMKALIKTTKEIGNDKQVKLIRNCLSNKFDLKCNVYKDRRVLDLMLKEFFTEEVLYEILIVPHHKSQKRYYEKTKASLSKFKIDE